MLPPLNFEMPKGLLAAAESLPRSCYYCAKKLLALLGEALHVAQVIKK